MKEKVEMSCRSKLGRWCLSMVKHCRLTMIAACLLLLVFGNSSASATGIDGFMDIPWGTSRGEIAKKMAELNYSRDPDSSGDTDIYVGMFAARRAYLTFVFINNVFWEGGANFLDAYHDVSEGDFRWFVDQNFSDYETQLTSKYGMPYSQYRFAGNEPWKPCGDFWKIEDKGITIQIELHKHYAYKDRSWNKHSVVGIDYKNLTLYDKEKQRSVNRDL